MTYSSMMLRCVDYDLCGKIISTIILPFYIKVWRRSSSGLVNPLGGDFPLITKDGHNVLNVIFTSPILNLADVADSRDQIDGVVVHGVIARISCTVVIVSEDGLPTVDNTLGLEGSKF